MERLVQLEKGREKTQIMDILSNIGAYQSLVDKNWDVAINLSDWTKRMNYVQDCLQELKKYNIL